MYSDKDGSQDLEFGHRPATHRSRVTLLIGGIFLIIASLGAAYTMREKAMDFVRRSCSAFAYEQNRVVFFTREKEWTSQAPEDQGRWDDLLPPNGGYVVQQDDNGERIRLGIAMFHELHCLQMLRTRMIALHEQLEDENVRDSGHQHVMTGDDDHWLHCFDYIRQGILCHADAAVEVASLVDGVYFINGTTGKHVCSDPGPLYELSIDSGLVDV